MTLVVKISKQGPYKETYKTWTFVGENLQNIAIEYHEQ